MSKEYLEALNGLFDLVHCQDSFEKAQKYFDIIEEALKRLEAIDNSNPSEALECLERIDNTLCLNNNKGNLEFGIDTEEHIDCDNAIDMVEDLETIKQYILKTQKPKNYLKWEDLEPFEEDKEIFGLLNGNKYTLHTYRDSKHKYVLISLNGINMSTLCDMFKQDIDFFNDLHLERVLE